MKKINVFSLLLTILLFAATTITAQYKFTDDIRLKDTPVKNQYRSGTCWSFSAISFLESELLRMGKGEFDLSEMWAVRNCYYDKGIKTVRLFGALNFGGGGAFHDVTYVLKNYGLVPENVYPGLNYGEKMQTHGEMDELLKDYIDGVIKNKNKKLSTAWKIGFSGILDAYLGKKPEKFTYKGKEYTPKSFSKEVLGLNADDYIEISSFTHHPFYKTFMIEIPDNWLWGSVYNLPLDEMMQVIDNALKNGYTVAWASDVSEKGFSWKNGIAIVPAASPEEMDNLESAKWDKSITNDLKKNMYTFEKPVPEKKITQELRQEEFDNLKTTDDHGMHIIGMAHDQNGTKYYIVKNSWGNGGRNGYFYASEAFVRLKTTDIMVHKDAVPKNIKKKLAL
ncbi:MAG: aminopeptidase [Bacteroidales bacterium]|nr:aminopeptidase [Bacteroidales bacterium]